MNAQELGNRPAFPTEQVVTGYGTTMLVGGMTYRQWLAGMAMQSLIMQWPEEATEFVAEKASGYADALLAREARSITEGYTEAGDER